MEEKMIFRKKCKKCQYFIEDENHKNYGRCYNLKSKNNKKILGNKNKCKNFSKGDWQ
jgi:hypothetical protein